MIANMLKQDDSIEVIKHNASGQVSTHVCKVLWAKDDGSLITTAPLVSGQPLALYVSSAYQIRFVTDDGVYRADVLLRNQGAMGNDYIFVFELINSIQAVPNRELPRLECDLTVRLRTPIEDEGRPNLCAIKDISGGGVKLLSGMRFRLLDIVEVPIVLKGVLDTVISAKVVNATISLDEDYDFAYGLSFVNIPKQIRETIVHYINRNLHYTG